MASGGERSELPRAMNIARLVPTALVICFDRRIMRLASLAVFNLSYRAVQGSSQPLLVASLLALTHLTAFHFK